ncbi:hypothetical protein QAD02_012514 [Eretmocerus hayati]|uniref:Uncharacterized protein n=1 Tax=Eretmocerus hayati TaxID=131215 RepID=A0ACC2NZZ5_9HYME|nr:hypothetical protein QAD02_012514 [Eretmocerus hayati]
MGKGQDAAEAEGEGEEEKITRPRSSSNRGSNSVGVKLGNADVRRLPSDRMSFRRARFYRAMTTVAPIPIGARPADPMPRKNLPLYTGELLKKLADVRNQRTAP